MILTAICHTVPIECDSPHQTMDARPRDCAAHCNDGYNVLIMQLRLHSFPEIVMVSGKRC